jgi:hypothetical protein
MSETSLFFTLLVLVTALPIVFFPIAAHAVPTGTSIEAATALLLFLGSQGHVAASFFFYGEPRARAFMLAGRKSRFVYVPMALTLMSALLVWGFGQGVLVSYYVLGYWIWQTHHYTRQNHGILAFVSRAASVPVSFAERTAVTLTGVAAVLGMITIVTPFQSTVLRLFAWQLKAIALGTYVAALVFIAAALRQRGPQPRMRLTMLVMLMVFYVPLFFFSDPLSAFFTYAIAHGLQYLVFMYFVALSPRVTRTRMLMLIALCALGGGAVLKFMERGEATFGSWHGAVFGLGLGIVMWHFVLDAGMWRLSEPFQRAYMSERFGFLRGPGGGQAVKTEDTPARIPAASSLR